MNHWTANSQHKKSTNNNRESPKIFKFFCCLWKFRSRGLCFLRNRLRFGRQGHRHHLWFNDGLLGFATPSISQVKGKQIWHPIIQMVLKSRGGNRASKRLEIHGKCESAKGKHIQSWVLIFEFLMPKNNLSFQKYKTKTNVLFVNLEFQWSKKLWRHLTTKNPWQ